MALSPAALALDLPEILTSIQISNGSPLQFLLSHSLSITGTGSKWTSGTVSGSGTLIIKPEADFDIFGSPQKTLDGAHLDNRGAVFWTGGDIQTGKGAQFTNAYGATFTITSNNTLEFSLGGTQTTFTNAGLVEKSGSNGSGATELQAIFTNSGTIDARAGTLRLSASAAQTNSGTLSASSGGTLELANGTWDNSDGDIEAGGDSRVEFENAAIIGGLLASIDAGRLVNVANSTFTDITLALGSTLLIDNSTTATFGGTFINHGTVTLNSTGHPTTFKVAGNGLTLRGGGTIKLANSPENILRGFDHTTSLINEDNTLRGTGKIGAGLLRLDNRGTIVADIDNSVLLLEPGESGALNTGTLAASNGGTLQLKGGTIENAGGTIRANAGSWVLFDGATILGGTLESLGTGSLGTFTGSSTLGGTLTLTPGTHLVIANDTSLTLLATGTFTNNGTLSLESTGLATKLILADGNVTLNGNGAIELSDHANNRVTGSGVAPGLTLTSGQTLQGSGNLGDDTLSLINHGNIIAQQTTPLVIDPGAAGMINTSKLRAENGATLVLQDGTFTNTGGVIEAFGSEAVVNFSHAVIENGTLHTANGGLLRNVASSTFANVQLTGTLEISNDTSATLIGEIINDGTIQLIAAGDDTTLNLGGDVSLTGTGVLELSNSTHNLIRGTTTLINDEGHTIRGSGYLGKNETSFQNFGLVEANQSNPLVIDVGNTSTFVNAGTLRASGGNLTIKDAFTNRGTIEVHAGHTLEGLGALTQGAGTLALYGGTLSVPSATFGADSLIRGAGTIIGAISSDGEISPGHTAAGSEIGTIVFNDSLTLQEHSKLIFQLRGVNQGSEYDFLQVNGGVTLGGTLRVTFLDGFESLVPAGATFTILTAAGGLADGFTFSNVVGRLLSTDFGTFEVTFDANAVVLSNFVAVPEPSTYVMLGIGALLVVATLRRKR